MFEDDDAPSAPARLRGAEESGRPGPDDNHVRTRHVLMPYSTIPCSHVSSPPARRTWPGFFST